MMVDRLRPSLADVARTAGVSPATVSRVINNTASVRETVRQRVLQAVSDLNYQAPPYAAAPTRPNVIALIIPDILNPYFTEAARGVQREASLDGYMLHVLDTNEDPERNASFCASSPASRSAGSSPWDRASQTTTWSQSAAGYLRR